MPIVTTLHTVLRNPDMHQRIALEEIAQLSDRMVVMSELAAELLRSVYAVPGGKIDVIQALPPILARQPNVVYIVSGVTHPHIRRHEGERYREGLLALAEQLGVSDHLILNNRFVSAEEFVEHVGAADIYIPPYQHEAQIVSGTLAIALGAGKAIFSSSADQMRDQYSGQVLLIRQLNSTKFREIQ